VKVPRVGESTGWIGTPVAYWRGPPYANSRSAIRASAIISAGEALCRDNPVSARRLHWFLAVGASSSLDQASYWNEVREIKKLPANSSPFEKLWHCAVLVVLLSTVHSSVTAAEPPPKELSRPNQAAGPGSQRLADEPMKFSVRPGVRFLTPTSAQLRWETTITGKAMVAYGPTRALGTVIESGESGTSHRVILSDLLSGKIHYYRFGLIHGGKRSFSPIYELDCSMNYMPPVIESSGLPAGAQAVLDRINQPGGYAVVLSDSPAEWAEAIAGGTSLTVVAAMVDEASIRELRAKWYREDRYGIRLTAQVIDSLPQRFANLVIGSPDQIESAVPLVSPSGKLVCIGKPPTLENVTWTLLAGGVSWGELSSQGELSQWGHQYGSAANASYAGETLGGVDDTSDLKVQWLGRPGADFGIDRNPRMPAPLATGGRLFHQGMNRMIALDAFNGAVLWSLEIPDLRRVNIPRDCANWCADQDHVFAAVKDRLWVIDAATGEMEQAFQLPPEYAGGHEWGYIADGGDVMIGTAVKQSSTYESFWDKASWYDGKDDSATAKVCGSAIVAYDKRYGDVRWQRDVDAAVHSTITLADDRIYFVEVDDASLQTAASGKLTNDKIWKNAWAVCLDLSDGKELWRKKVPPQEDAVIVSFGVADDRQFVLQTSSNQQFHFVSLDRDSGSQRWERSISWPEDHHGAPMQHAVLMNGKLFVQPHIVDATNGNVIKSGTLGKRRGCATPIGAGNSIIYRGGTGPLTLWSLDRDEPSEFTRLRSSCWLSTIPAQGMLFSPEGGGGCSCGGWMETSIGFTPLIRDEAE
jgi:outer membrane protein assembly factor BamB